MSFIRASKYVKLPFELNLANDINDNFTVQFQKRSATRFRASNEFTKFIDDDYTNFLNKSLIQSNMSKQFKDTGTNSAGRQNKDMGTNTEGRQNKDMGTQADDDIEDAYKFEDFTQAKTPDEDAIRQEEERRRMEREDRNSAMARDIMGGARDDVFGQIDEDDVPDAGGASSSNQPMEVDPNAVKRDNPEEDDAADHSKGRHKKTKNRYGQKRRGYSYEFRRNHG